MDVHDEPVLHIKKGSGLTKGTPSLSEPKHFIFDLDETIGSFSELYLLFQCINSLPTSLHTDPKLLVDELLLLFPEFFRHGINVIMTYLYKKKQTGACSGIHIYTNNSCLPDTWCYFIMSFIEERWNMKDLFDSVIRAFKIDGKIVESKRTVNEKTHKDLLNCLLLPYDTEFCFIDNDHYAKMEHRYVYYLQPRPYYHYMTREQIIERFLNSYFGKQISTFMNQDIQPLLYKWYKSQNYSMSSTKRTLDYLETDLNTSNQLFKHVRKFFKMTRRKLHTCSNRISPDNTSRKNRL
jgi:hypothetical protein